VSAREMHRQGLMSKEGGRQALDHYFHQVPHPGRAKEKAP